MKRTMLSAAALTAVLAVTACPARGGESQGCAPVARADAFSSEHWEWRLTFAPHRLQAYWSVSENWWPGARDAISIVSSQWRPGGWTAPEVAPFSGTYQDMDPFISPDGRTLYFSSMRPVDGETRTDMDLWMVRRTWTGWSEPIHLGHEVNAPGYDELYSSVDLWGNLYFARVKAPVPSEDVNIWRSARRRDGTYAPPEMLGPGVNTPDHWEYNPEISPDGRTLLFASLSRPDSYGWGDLYISRLRHGEFTPAENLGPCVNTGDDEYHPTVLWERRLLFFARNDFDPGGSHGDFYYTRLQLPRY